MKVKFIPLVKNVHPADWLPEGKRSNTKSTRDIGLQMQFF